MKDAGKLFRRFDVFNIIKSEWGTLSYPGLISFLFNGLVGYIFMFG
jgi:hypothetical protein